MILPWSDLTEYGSGAIMLVKVEVLYTDDFREWFAGLSTSEQDTVAVAVKMLEQAGVALRFPVSSAIKREPPRPEGTTAETGAQPAPSHLRLQPHSGRSSHHRGRQERRRPVLRANYCDG